MNEHKITIPPLKNGVIQSPDGEVQYFTKILDKNNPYLKQDKLIQNNQLAGEIIELEYLDETIRITQTHYENAILLENKAIMVRIICLVDLFTNIFTLQHINSNLVFILMVICWMAYYSTYMYNRGGLILFLLYLYLQLFIKGGFIVIYILYYNIDEFREKIEGEDITLTYKNLPENIVYIYTGSVFLVQLLITNYVRQFYNLLPFR